LRLVNFTQVVTSPEGVSFLFSYAVPSLTGYPVIDEDGEGG